LIVACNRVVELEAIRARFEPDGHLGKQFRQADAGK
jgi:hypothetical protein